jgi:hypothetical protein
MYDDWVLYRHKRDRTAPGIADTREPTGEPVAVYWMRPRKVVHSDDAYSRHEYIADYEVRSPLNAAGNGSEEPGEILPPEASARSGRFPVKAVREHYTATTPEELGLRVVAPE